MPLPGLGGAPGGLVLVLTSANATYDVAAALGNPSGAVFYTLIVPSGVTRGAADASSPAIDASGLHADSEGYWIVDGDVIGAGGDGGDGQGYFQAGPPFAGDIGCGGGGGGAGLPAGAAGAGYQNGTNGSAGSTWPTTTGGAAGANSDNASNGTQAAVAATAGGDAIRLNHAVTIEFSGNIGGGGGGGAPGTSAFGVTLSPGAGGDLGVAGGGTSGGAAGYAIRYSGSGNATINGAGTLYGTVG